MAGDPFLSDPSRKRKRSAKIDTRRANAARKQKKASAQDRGQSDHDDDEDEDDVDSDSDTSQNGLENESNNEEELSSDEEFADENAADKRRRLAKQYLENLKQSEFDGDGDEFFDAQDLDDDIIARRLQTDVAEQKGFVYKFIGDKVAPQLHSVAETISTTRIGSKNPTCVAVRWPYAYTVSKDSELIKWRFNGDKKMERVKHTKGGSRKYLELKSEARLNHHCEDILCVATSPDGKYVVTGGKDGRLVIWSSENLSCLKVLETRSAVNLIVFRRGTDQMYAACSDLRIRTYSINQFAQLEVLYGHQDNISDISALSRETCVSVGSRDKTAMFWKIAEESRLTFRGGDSTEKKRKRKPKAETEKGAGTEKGAAKEEASEAQEEEEAFHNEGSIEVVSMLDESHFVTGSDNGNVALWSLAKKKALCTKRLAHGLRPIATAQQASAEVSEALAAQQVPEPLPYWITAIHAIPFSDVFVTGSYDGTLRVWKLDREGLRSFELIGQVNNVNGFIVRIESAEMDGGRIKIVALTSKEHKFGRWMEKVEGARNALVSFSLSI